ncbi:MAG: outer membrane lipoprotein carrier protein LolA, partial [Bacteroidales bacterium]|nr:outer membrane lipoprotein carrier protein LolA [Bacteroidales bacterium]
MRKIRIVSFLLLFSFVALPQVILAQSAKSSEILLNELKRQISQLKTSEVLFDFVARSSDGAILLEQSGVFVAQDDSFVMSTDIIDLYCDGVSKWILEKELLEMTIVPHDKSLNDITENPFGVLRNLDLSLYKFPKKSKVAKIDSQVLQVITLTPKEKDPNYTSIVISLSDNTHLPISIEYFSRTGDSYFVRVNSIGGI